MREIEFRGKSKIDYETDNGFVYGYYFRSYGCKNGVKYYTDFIFDCEKEVYYPIDINTLGQYTGLKDKNGTKIFEGDIFAWGSTLYQVIYADFGFKVNYVKDHNDIYLYDFQLNYFEENDEIEVVGNIYEDDDLLE